jgi:hypothetical protein
VEDDFLFLRTKVQARDGRSAIDEGIRNLQFCIGVLNLVIVGFGLSKRFGLPGAPLGRLLLASSTLLVDQNKRTVGDWVGDNNYPRAFKQSFTAKDVDLDELVPYARRWVRQIKRTDFSDRISTAIILFQEGLSATQVDVALIKLWTCIELLTARPDGREPIERAIDRASSIFSAPQITKLRLEFIANSRHAVVHKGESGEHA